MYDAFIEKCRMYNRICKMGDNRLTKRTLIWDVCNNSSGWYLDFLKVCALVDIGCFEFLKPIDLTYFTTKCVEHGRMFLQNEISKAKKAVLLKDLYAITNLVKFPINIIDRDLRSFLSKLLSGTLKLSIETGRFHNIQRNMRLCKICNQIEDEYHFLFSCKLYNIPRLLLLKKSKLQINDCTFIDLFRNLYHNHCRALCKYIKDCWYIRQKFILNTR